LNANKNGNSFRQCILAQFKLKNSINNVVNNSYVKLGKKADVSRAPSSISLRLSKKVLENSKFYKNKSKDNVFQVNTQSGHSYAQASIDNIKNIVKIKENFSNLSVKKIEDV